jgi:hypothetical protein
MNLYLLASVQVLRENYRLLESNDVQINSLLPGGAVCLASYYRTASRFLV